jgi:hypothetical protein
VQSRADAKNLSNTGEKAFNVANSAIFLEVLTGRVICSKVLFGLG